MPDPSQNLIGGRYEIISTLGKGGMGVVYKAYDPVLDRTVAIKKMAANIVDHDEFRQRFFVEARAVARLNHPNIVTIHELEEDEGGIYIIMEMLDGVSLSAVMKHGDVLSRDAQVTLLAKVCSGLDYAHVRGVIHRDIKPANLMLTTTGGVKILDFGIARFAASEMTSLGGTMLGTPHYMSPEQIEGRPVDARADWFSYGAVAYELIARQKPFDAPSVPPLLMKITSTPHTPLIDIVPDTVSPLSAIVDRLLAKDRDQRPSSGADVQCALNASGDTNREDLIAAVVKSVLGDAGDVTLVQPMSARGTTAPLIAAKPSAPMVITGTGTTPVGLRPGVNAPLAPGDPTVGVPTSTRTTTVAPPTLPGQPIPPATVTMPGTVTQSIAPGTPVPVNTAGLPNQPPPAGASTVPVATVVTSPMPTAAPSDAAAAGLNGGAADAGAVLPASTAAVPAAPVSAPPAPHTPLAAAQPVASDIPAARSSLKGALVVVLVLVFVIGLSGVGALWWFVTHTTTGRMALNGVLGRKPASTTASAELSSTPTLPSSPSGSSSPGSTASTPTASESVPAAAGASSAAPASNADAPNAAASDTPTPGAAASSAASVPSAGASNAGGPNGSTPSAGPASGSAPNARGSSGSTPSTAPPSGSVPNASASGASTPTSTTPSASASAGSRASTGVPLATPPRVADPPARPANDPRTPRTDGSRHVTAPGDPLPPERGPAPPPPPPADDTPRLPSHDTRAPLDQATVDAFKNSRSSSIPAGYGNVDSPMMAASVVRIKDTLETYSQAIEHQDLDTLRSVREPITPAESAQAQSASPTAVRFSEVDVRTDGKTAAVRARCAITVGGASKANGYVDIRLSRRPAGWVITDIR